MQRSRYYPVTERPHMYEEFNVSKLYGYPYKNLEDKWEKTYHQEWHPKFVPLSVTFKSHLERKTRWSPGDVYTYSYAGEVPGGYHANRLRRIPYCDTYRYYSHLI